MVYKQKSLSAYDGNASLAIICIGNLAYVYMVQLYLIARMLLSLAKDANEDADVSLSNTKRKLMKNSESMAYVTIMSTIAYGSLSIYYYQQTGINLAPYTITEILYSIAVVLIIPVTALKFVDKEVLKREKQLANNPIKEGNVEDYETGKRESENS